MPKNTENLPITQDKPNISRKSLPLYKKIQYFVQGNRGWVVKTMGLFVAAILIVSLFLMQDKVIPINPEVMIKNKTVTITPQVDSAANKLPLHYDEILINKANNWAYTPLTSTRFWEERFQENEGYSEAGKTMTAKRAFVITPIINDPLQQKLVIKFVDNKIVNAFFDSNTTVYAPKYIYDEENNIADIEMIDMELSLLRHLGVNSKILISYDDNNLNNGDDIRASIVVVADIVK